jgi:hypothetical protein
MVTLVRFLLPWKALTPMEFRGFLTMRAFRLLSATLLALGEMDTTFHDWPPYETEAGISQVVLVVAIRKTTVTSL